MSGLTGIISTKTIDKSIIKAMTSTLQHRGPDAEGFFNEQGLALGYRHFSVEDKTFSETLSLLHLNRYAVTLDGRIYNLPELQEELLQQGYSFTSLNDAELLAAAYDHWGTDCLNKLNADWSFVLYDTQEKQFFIARDRFGVKPLYYYAGTEEFIFGSEVKAIYASGLVEKAPNETYLKAYLKEGPNEYDAPTAFKNIQRFPLAHYFLGAEHELLNQPHFKQYWNLQVNTEREKFCSKKAKEYADEYYALLADAVRLRMHAGVRVGAALSGGLDSSSIVYLIHQELKKQGKQDRLQTFSSVYNTPGTEYCDESQFINLVAQSLDVENYQIEPDVKEIPSEHEKMIFSLENPPENTLMSSWYSFKNISAHNIRVNLEGQGADEQLSGYLNYICVYLLSLHYLDFYKEVFSFLKMKGTKRQVIKALILFHIRLAVGVNLYNRLFRLIFKKNDDTSLNEVLKKDIEQSLPNQFHMDVSAASAHKVEIRMPFIDHRLVDFLARVPACYKMHNGWTKYLARQAFDNKLPDSVIWRKDKMGWGIPEKKWFFGELNSWLCEKVNNSKLLIKIVGKVELKEGSIFSLRDKLKKLNIAVFEEIFNKN